MNKLIFILCIYFMCKTPSISQSIEIMPGAERIFVDVQFLEFFDQDLRWSLFSRSRATSSYTDSKTDLFTGSYMNYTSRFGFGGTILGRISSNGGGIDAGIHFFKSSKSFMIYALTSININDELLYSWFSIFRYTPLISEKWKGYLSIELFSAFAKVGHLSSVQRLRIGAESGGYQFGLALNLQASGTSLNEVDSNPGIFIRKAF